MIELPTVLLFIALVAYGIFGPVITKGDNFRNNAAFVIVPEKNTDGSFRGNWGPAVLTQELGEWRIKHFIGLMLALPLVMVNTLPGLEFVLYLIGTVIISASLRYMQFFDYAGHGAELIEAERLNVVTIKGPNGPTSDTSIIATSQIRTVDYYEALPGDFVSYRQGEVERMIKLDNREDMTPQEIEDNLERYKWLAKIMHWMA